MSEDRTIVEGLNQFLRDRDRRAFLKLAGVGTAALAVPLTLTGCDDPVDKTKEDDIRLGSEYAGLNLMYALLQLNADFMARIVANKFAGMTSAEFTLFNSNVNQAWQQGRNSLQNGITSGRVTDAILFDFSTVDFSSRTSVITLLVDLTELLTAAANGIVTTLKSNEHITHLAKMHSVWGRLTASIHDELAITAGGSAAAARGTAWASSIGTDGLDATVTPADAYAATDAYFRTELNITGA